MEKGIYNLLQENHYSWITSVKGDNIKPSANYIWKYSKQTALHVKSHEKNNAYKKNYPTNQRTLISNNGSAQLNLSIVGLTFSPQEHVIRAEIDQCLQVVRTLFLAQNMITIDLKWCFQTQKSMQSQTKRFLKTSNRRGNLHSFQW